MELAQFTELMTRLGPDSPDIEEVEQTGDDHWDIGLSIGIVIMADWATDPSRVVFSTLIGRPHVDRRYLVYENLLAFNSLWKDSGGAKIAVDGAEGEVMLIYDLFIDNDFSLADLNNVLHSFVEYADLWCQYVTSAPEAALSKPMPPLVMSMLA